MTLEFFTVDFRTAPDDVLIEDIELVQASRRLLHPDDPQPAARRVVAQHRTFPADYQFLVVHARRAGRLVAVASVGAYAGGSNAALGQLGVIVHPDERRRGTGTALVQRMLDMLPVRLTSLTAGTSCPAGRAFAQRCGMRAGNQVHTNRLLLGRVDRSMLDEWDHDVGGYTVLAIDGPYPEGMLEEIGGMFAIMNDAPQGSLDVQPQEWTADRMRAMEDAFAQTGVGRWLLAVRHDATQQLVGLTVVFLDDATPWSVSQGDTGVRSDHRGRGLAKLLKARMLKRILAERPAARDVRTNNADSNDPMLAINTRLGFEPYEARTFWQASVQDVRSALAEPRAT